MSEPKISAVPARDFEDAGLQRAYTKGKMVELPEGVFNNYAAAGLVRAATDAEAKAKPAT